MHLTHHTILITGGTSGIGQELARQLLAKNNTVIVTGRDAKKLAATQAALPGVHILQSDVSDPSALTALAKKVVKQFPALNILINNAGIMHRLNLHDPKHTPEYLTQEIDINLSGPIRLTHLLLPHLKTQPTAAIINVSSALAFMPLPIAPVYSATKAGLHAFTQALRVQLSRTRVKVIELAPPGVETPLFSQEFKDDLRNAVGMDVKVLVAKAIAGLEKGHTEIRPGLSNLLKLMSRLAPNFILAQAAKMADKMLAES